MINLLSALPSDSLINAWTDPLPNDLVPIITDLLWSCRAPATISAAEAVPELINVTIFNFGALSEKVFALNT
jgi:hypothetical protein